MGRGVPVGQWGDGLGDFLRLTLLPCGLVSGYLYSMPAV